MNCAVYDSGANLCLASDRLLKSLKANLIKNKSLLRTLNRVRFTESRARLRIKMGEIEDFVNVPVVKTEDRKFAYDLLIGQDAITIFKLIQDEQLNIHQRISELVSIPYRCSFPDQKEIENQVAELLAAGLVKESSSPCATPVSLAYKKNANRVGENSRMVIDLRELNK